MALQWLVGNAGSGKTHYMYNQVIQKSIANPDETILIIVPEQFTLETQKKLVHLHPKKGLLNIEVLSFQRLAYRLIDDLQIHQRKLLGDVGKAMMIRKVVDENATKFHKLSKTIHKKGVLDNAKTLLTEFYQYGVSEELLTKTQKILEGQQNNKALSDKIHDAVVLYRKFQEKIETTYITNETTLGFLAQGILRNDWIAKATVYVDGFYGYTPNQYSVISAILSRSSMVYMTLTVDVLEQLNVIRFGDFYTESKEAYRDISNIATSLNIPILNNHVFNETVGVRFFSSDLNHLERHLFRYPCKKYEQEPTDQGLMLGYANSLRDEVRTVADSIVKLVMAEKIRYKEVAVLVGELGQYRLIVEKIFRQYAIPFFIDAKPSILEHPIIECILSAFKTIAYNYKYEHVFGMLKTGYFMFDFSELDLLENYILAWGIRGRSQWHKPFVKPYPNGDDESFSKLAQVNELRIKFCEAMITFDKAFEQADTVRTKTSAFHEWLVSLKISEKLELQSEQLKTSESLQLAQLYKRIYSVIIDLTDQLVEILGEDSISTKAYYDLFDAGLSQCEVGLIPPSLDQVIVGDLDRTRLSEVQYLFVLGLNEGKVPKGTTPKGILTDQERLKIAQLGLLIAPDQKRALFKEQFNIFMGLLRGRKALYLSYALSDANGKALRPSPIISTLKKMYPLYKFQDYSSLYETKFIWNQPVPTLLNWLGFMAGQSIQKKDQIPQEVYSVYKWFAEKESWRETMDITLKGLYHYNQEKALGLASSEALYGEILVNSVTRLEEFSKCPFSHFMSYGLHATRRLEYNVTLPDIGVLFHKALEIFTKKMIHRKLEFATLAHEERDVLVAEAIQEAIALDARGVFLSTFRYQYLVNRLTRITKRAVWGMQKQISKGVFRPSDVELSFNKDYQQLEALNMALSNEKKMKLMGVIDRVDTFEDEANSYFSIVDYKSGNKSFDLVALYYGLQLQLIVYLNAVLEIKQQETTKQVIPAGVFYYQLHDPILKLEERMSDERLEHEVSKMLKLKGLVLNDPEVFKLFDTYMDKDSTVVPVSLKANNEPTAAASVASLETFRTIQSYVRKKSIEIGNRIVDGHIEIEPYKLQQQKGCDYCNYRSICQFDPSLPENNYMVLQKEPKQVIMEKMARACKDSQNPDS